ncbi:uncharacterized protein ACA1_306560 [Acanthamoeba castellanii str. Neff]|uniref:Uncharacterized protein n=1 Tax=Acanthamoeba castellanii (strain ATCC 30010 / Neff) TaxID=1257118 RepID=L8HD66_ACACF|nr:uncharacterized protein ACA1_306560 [Acanthamoeba castellanii str. Neff]ELR23100.1 hypothetical protein ACA1_306560 [Acanthamoeba castellanii str. Neff]
MHVTALCKHFKALRSTLHLCVVMASLHRELASGLYGVTVTVLYAMRLQLDAHDKIYIHCRYSEDTLTHFNILSDSTLVSERQARLLDTVTLALAAVTNRSRL